MNRDPLYQEFRPGYSPMDGCVVGLAVVALLLAGAIGVMLLWLVFS